MHRFFLLFSLALMSVVVGCDVPYKAEYDEAMRLKGEAEQKLVEAKAATERAKNALTAEQNAMNRLYTED